jgi:hypothetical protein
VAHEGCIVGEEVAGCRRGFGRALPGIAGAWRGVIGAEFLLNEKWRVIASDCE